MPTVSSWSTRTATRPSPAFRRPATSSIPQRVVVEAASTATTAAMAINADLVQDNMEHAPVDKIGTLLTARFRHRTRRVRGHEVGQGWSAKTWGKKTHRSAAVTMGVSSLAATSSSGSSSPTASTRPSASPCRRCPDARPVSATRTASSSSRQNSAYPGSSWSTRTMVDEHYGSNSFFFFFFFFFFVFGFFWRFFFFL